MGFWANRSGLGKVITVLACAFLLGAGLCGLDFALGAHGIGKPQQEFSVGPLDLVSMYLMFFSGVLLVGAVLVWVVVFVVREIRGK